MEFSGSHQSHVLEEGKMYKVPLERLEKLRVLTTFQFTFADNLVDSFISVYPAYLTSTCVLCWVGHSSPLFPCVPKMWLQPESNSSWLQLLKVFSETQFTFSFFLRLSAGCPVSSCFTHLTCRIFRFHWITAVLWGMTRKKDDFYLEQHKTCYYSRKLHINCPSMECVLGSAALWY